MRSSESGTEVRIVLFYVLFSGLWILLSDFALLLLVRDEVLLTTLQTYKGWGYIIISGFLLLLLLRSEFQKRNRVSQSLRKSEAQYRNLIEQASDGIFIFEYAGRILLMNESAGHMLGYGRGELLAADFWELVPGEDGPAIKKHLHDLTLGDTLLTEQKLLRKDGAYLPVEINVKAVEPQVFQGIVRDISNRIHSEQQLRRWADIFENIRMGVAIGEGGAGVFTLVNPAFAEMHGYSVEELNGKPISSIFVPQERPGLGEHIRIAQEQGHHIFESTHLRKNGETFPVNIDVTTVKDPAGDVLYRVVSVQDITARQRAKKALEDQVNRLAALRKVDIAITSMLDVRMILDVLLEQVIDRSRVDAAAVLILNQKTQYFDWRISRGFLPGSFHSAPLSIGKGLAGTVVLEQRPVAVADLSKLEDEAARKHLVYEEGFSAYLGVPLSARGEVKGVLEVFNRSALPDDPDWLSFLETLAGQAAIAIENIQLYEDLQRSNLELAQAYDATLEGWAKALELRDQETVGHSLRVAEQTVILAQEMGIEDEKLVHVRRGALLHDIGKMGIPDSILLKQGPLTSEEWEVMRMHPIYAREMLAGISYLRPALDIPYCHHEKWDGSGYPRGLKGKEIPLAARIFSVVDAWDALRSERPYRPAWTVEQARQHLLENASTHFDPQVAERFLEIISAIEPTSI